MFTRIAEMWCKATHKQPMWPIHGQYTCPQCLRAYAVPWEAPVMIDEYARPELRRSVTVSTETMTVVQ